MIGFEWAQRFVSVFCVREGSSRSLVLKHTHTHFNIGLSVFAAICLIHGHQACSCLYEIG